MAVSSRKSFAQVLHGPSEGSNATAECPVDSCSSSSSSSDDEYQQRLTACGGV